MKSSKVLFAVTLLMILLTYSCQSPRNCKLTEDERIEISKEIETIIEYFVSPDLDYQTHIDLGADTIGHLYAGDGSFIFSDYQSYGKNG